MRHGRAPALSRSPARTLRHPPSLSLSRWPARSPGLNLSCYSAALPRANRAPRTRDDTGYPRASGSRTRAAREPPIRPPGAPRKDPRAGRRGVGGGRGALPDLSLPFCAVQREMPGAAGSVGRGFLGTWGGSGGGGAGGRARGSGSTPRACGWLSRPAAVAGEGGWKCGCVLASSRARSAQPIRHAGLHQPTPPAALAMSGSTVLPVWLAVSPGTRPRHQTDA